MSVTVDEILDALAEDDIWPADVEKRFPGIQIAGIRALAMGLATALCGACNGYGSCGPDPKGQPIECSTCGGIGAL